MLATSRNFETAAQAGLANQNLQRALGLEVLVTKRVWECGPEIVIPEGIPIRTALDDLAAQHGFRWALDRSLYIVD